jgi:hypothetical protein
MQFEDPIFNNELQPDYVKDVSLLYFEEGVKAAKQADFFVKAKEHVCSNYPEVEFIGIGTQSIVVGDSDHPDRVLTYEYKRELTDPLKYLELYHVHNLLHHLYPETFPAIHGIDFQVALKNKGRVIKHADNGYSAADMERISYTMAMHIGETSGLYIWLDSNPKNFICDKEGSLKYIDLIAGDTDYLHVTPSRIMEFFDKKYASCVNQRKVKNRRKRTIYHVQRLIEIPAIAYYHKMARRYENSYFDFFNPTESLRNFTVPQQRRIMRNLQELNPQIDLSRFF